MARHSDRLRLPPGRTLVRAGETARELIAIVTGEAAMLRFDGTVARLRAGDEIGGGEVVRHERHTATVIAASPIEVVVVNGPAVRHAHQVGAARFPQLVGRGITTDQMAA
jgi:CRP-like cAMP-binding protein